MTKDELSSDIRRESEEEVSYYPSHPVQCHPHKSSNPALILFIKTYLYEKEKSDELCLVNNL